MVSAPGIYLHSTFIVDRRHFVRNYPPGMMGSCRECDRLWHEYAEAVRAALKIAGNRQIAEIGQDSAALAAIEPLYLEALDRRILTRKAVRDHAATHRKVKSAGA
jgi:hypothetical protein